MTFYLIKNKTTGMFLNALGKWITHPGDALWYKSCEAATSEHDRRCYYEQVEMFELKVSRVLM